MLEPSYEAVNAYSPAPSISPSLRFSLSLLRQYRALGSGAARFRFAGIAVFASYNRLGME